MLLALALAASLESDWTPPPARYDHEYDGKIIVQMMHPRKVPAACRALFESAGLDELRKSVGPRQRGCAVVWRKAKICKVIIIDRPSETGRTPEQVVRHERAHCNGWHSSHPD